MPEPKKFVRRISRDPSLDSYQGFFDHSWAKQIHNVAEGKKFDQALFDLTSSWKGTSNARRMPWLMIRLLKGMLEGYARMKVPFPVTVAEAFLKNVSKMMGDTPFTQKQLERMKLVFADIQGRLWSGLEAIPPDFANEIDGFWEEIVGESDFSLSLWKSEENAYVAIYFAYEDYVSRLVGLGKGTSGYKLSDTFQEDFVSLFGSSMFDTCWACKPVRVARLVRNAMLHNGGRLTADLKKIDHGLRLEGEQIILIAPDTTNLYNLLKDRASGITEKVGKDRDIVTPLW